MYTCHNKSCFFGILHLDFMTLVNFSSYGKPFDLVFCAKIYCIGEGISTLMSFSDGLDPYVVRRKMEKTRSMMEEINVKVFIFRPNWLFSFVNIMIKVLIPICTSTRRANNYVSRLGKGKNRRNESSNIIFIICCFE